MFKEQTIADLTDFINEYIERIESAMNDTDFIKVVRQHLQESQKSTFLLFAKEGRSKLRKDIINDLTEYYRKYDITKVLERMSIYHLSDIIYRKLITNGIDKYAFKKGNCLQNGVFVRY